MKNPENDEVEVVQHANNAALSLLLCGPNNTVNRSAPDFQQRSARFLHHQSDPSLTFPNFPDETRNFPAPGEVPRIEKSEKQLRMEKIKTAQFFSKLREDEKFAKNMSEKLDLYDSMAKKKTLMHKKDYDEHFSKPLQSRIKEKMEPENYRNYLTKKHRLIKSMDLSPVAIRSESSPAPIATLKVSTSGLKDPNLRYQKRKEEENRLEQFLREANGEIIEERKVPSRKTLDYKQFTAQRETRFAFGNDPEMANKHGKKVFENSGISTIGNEFKMF